ncbi:hypothetical protein FOMPIDRAFT_1016335 [Fomitopsis schrenkii]|uniref:Uncharacterized protein n=1 Tax=Fomitopsis schrenkii TaxID=2126942 RepID=S8E7X1_FOMSC|nr:hypothetical protein FOMPIDRAFT_1016335 [Fomitopsis schrenkii]
MMDGFKSVASQFANNLGLTKDGQCNLCGLSQDLAVPPQSEHAAPAQQQADHWQANQSRRSRSRSPLQTSSHEPATRVNKDMNLSSAESTQTRSKSVSNQPPNSIAYGSAKGLEERILPSRELERQNQKLQWELKNMTEAMHQSQQKAITHERERDSARAHYDALQKELNTVRYQEEVRMNEYDQMKALLEARRQELHDAQRFMGTADTVAESEIVQEFRDLNTEIFNLAQSMSDAKVRSGHEREQRKAAEDLRAIGIFSDKFLDILRSADLRGDTVLLEIAMQEAASRGDSFFMSVYKRIRNSENQSVAGQWRALTRKSAEDRYLRRALREGRFEDELTELLVYIATLSGVRFSTTAHAQAVELMIAKALKIRHLIGEAMISSDYEVVVPPAGTAFTTAGMEDAFKPREVGPGPRGASSFVLCCTSLGLRRVEKVEGELRSTTLVKSDVGLDTLLEDLGLPVDVNDDKITCDVVPTVCQTRLLLVGGFATSPFLRNELSDLTSASQLSAVHVGYRQIPKTLFIPISALCPEVLAHTMTAVPQQPS